MLPLFTHFEVNVFGVLIRCVTQRIAGVFYLDKVTVNVYLLISDLFENNPNLARKPMFSDVLHL